MKRIIGLILALSTVVTFLCFPVHAAYGEEQTLEELSIEISPREWELVRQINIFRMENGQNPVSVIAKTQEAAAIRAREASVTAAHTRPDGRSPFTVYRDLDFSYTYASEILAWKYSSAEGAMNGWKDSTRHRDGMLSPKPFHIGAGFYEGGKMDITWTAVFVSADCESQTLEVIFPRGLSSFEEGTAIDDMGIIAKLGCKAHGDSYMPVTSAMCPGFDSTAGNKALPLEICGVSCSLNVSFKKAADAQAPISINGDGAPGYSDVRKEHWFYDCVAYVGARGIMSETAGDRFSPDAVLTREMLADAVYKMAGSPEVGYSPVFSDVGRENRFAPAIIWCYSQGITKGTGSDTFNPGGAVSREQLMTMIYRYNEVFGGKEKKPMSLAKFSDAADVGSWALEAMEWAYGGGYIEGVGSGRLNPGGTALRSHGAAVLARYCAF